MGGRGGITGARDWRETAAPSASWAPCMASQEVRATGAVCELRHGAARRVCALQRRRSCVRAGPLRAFVCCAARFRLWYSRPTDSAYPLFLCASSKPCTLPFVGAYGGQRQAHAMSGHAQAAHGSPARAAYGYGSGHQSQHQVAQTATQQQQLQAAASWQLDETVKHNKNLRDSMIVENWIRKSQLIMQKFKLSPLPDALALDGSHSETGTEYSAALTMEHDQVASALCVAHAKCGAEQARRYFFCNLPSCAIALCSHLCCFDSQQAYKTPEVSPPDSPPWRIENEGGVPAQMPDFPLQEIQQHLAAMQEQQRIEHAEQEARRAHQEEEERRRKELQQKQAEEKRRHQQMLKEQYQKQEEARRQQQQQKQQHKNSDRPNEDAAKLPGQSTNAPGVATDAAPPTPAPVAKQITLGLSFAKCEEGPFPGALFCLMPPGTCVAPRSSQLISPFILIFHGLFQAE